MTAPALAASRFAMAMAVGAVLGLLYGFLRPLRPRLTHLADGFFVLAAFAGWIYLGFGICGGDLRLAYTLGMALGGFAWEITVGRLLRPVFRLFWRAVGKIVGIIFLPVKIIPVFFRKNCKKLLAIFRKWVTIGKNSCQHSKDSAGGNTHDETKEKIPAGIAQKSPRRAGHSHRHHHHRHRGADRAVLPH